MDGFVLLMGVVGLVILVVGAEFLVRGAARLAAAAGVSPLVIGLTVVAYGTSAPELAVSLKAAWGGNADIALGNVVGSNICNVLLILGLSAAILPLTVSLQLIRFDVPLMIGLSFMPLVMGWDGQIGRVDGLLLAFAAVAYTWICIRQSRKERKEALKEFDAEYQPSEETKTASGLLKNVGLLVLGLFLLVMGSRWLVDAAVMTAAHFGISQLVIGLTVVAVGTSLPEVATSVVASIRGERDIAVGNVIGSNIFNIASVLGFSAVLAPQGIAVSPTALWFDIPVMILIAVACLPLFFTGQEISRWEGVMFLSYYVLYTSYLVLTATEHDSLAAFNRIVLYLVAPVTFITIGVSIVRAFRRGDHKTLKRA